VAEEDREVALLLQDLLERSGYTVLRVADHTEIREELKKGSYAALIQDLLLPDGKGLDLIRHLRSDPETRAIPIVGISASVKEGRLVLRGAFNTIDWLEKPFDPEKLLKIVEKAIRQQKGIKPRILHVEDDPDLAQILATIGEDLAVFDLAPSLAKAREKLAQQSYTLIILDIALPDGSGWELLPLLKTLKPAPPVVLLSSSEPGRSQSQAVEAVLTKGKVSNTDILETLKAILKNPESSHES
jgi:DNA-binding response OmpR family regulator